jgi:hypothetical protein
MDSAELTVFATVRAVGVILCKGLVAPKAPGRLQIRPGGVDIAALIDGMAASFAEDERLPFSSPEDRNKEERNVVVNAG